MGRLTTHVLDTSSGKPAAGMRVALVRANARGAGTTVAEIITNKDGRGDAPLLEGANFIAANYQLIFHVGDYFAATRSKDAKKFLDLVPILFTVQDPALHYHVPLLVSPWAYSTYRGS